LGFENGNWNIVGAERKSHLERKGNWETGKLEIGDLSRLNSHFHFFYSKNYIPNYRAATGKRSDVDFPE